MFVHDIEYHLRMLIGKDLPAWTWSPRAGLVISTPKQPRSMLVTVCSNSASSTELEWEEEVTLKTLDMRVQSGPARHG